MTDESPIETARREGRSTLSEAEAKALLADAGIATPEHRVVSTPDDAVDAAAAIGYPVVAKVASPSIVHKSEWGGGVGVAVGLDSEDAVREAATNILDAGDEAGEDVDVLIEEAADLEDGIETIVGGVRDPSFGPTVLAGLGGIFAEVFEDVSHRLAPIDDREAREMLDELDSAAALRGYRGQPPVDVDALAETVRIVGDLLVEHDDVAEIDVNPVLASADGAIALDAFVSLTD